MAINEENDSKAKKQVIRQDRLKSESNENQLEGNNARRKLQKQDLHYRFFNQSVFKKKKKKISQLK